MPPEPSPPSNPPATPPDSSSILRPIYTTLLVTCPIILLLPPRKLDLYTLGLFSAWVVSAEELAFGRAAASAAGARRKASGKNEQEIENERKEDGKGGDEKEKGEGVSGLLRTVWMGDEKPGWQRRRLEREKAELERGRGYGEMIMEQVWEVFPGFGRGGRKGGEGEGEGGGEGGREREGRGGE